MPVPVTSLSDLQITFWIEVVHTLKMQHISMMLLLQDITILNSTVCMFPRTDLYLCCLFYVGVHLWNRTNLVGGIYSWMKGWTDISTLPIVTMNSSFKNFRGLLERYKSGLFPTSLLDPALSTSLLVNPYITPYLQIPRHQELDASWLLYYPHCHIFKNLKYKGHYLTDSVE